MRIEVYNTLGQTVDVIVDAEREPGFHTVKWNAEDVASGVYFYRLAVREFTATRRMVVMK